MNPWSQLKQFTSARVALGRAGSSLPTAALLDFELARARARDAVHASFDVELIERGVESLGWRTVRVRSAACDRAEYLRRPDLGRRLHTTLQDLPPPPPDLIFAIADGLSARAAQSHAIPLLSALQPRLIEWRVGPIFIAEQARVALADELGEICRAKIAVILIGERPGLSAPDSLGAYLTYEPRVGRSDAERNCLSNIRPEGLTYELAAYRLLHLLEGARRLGLSGIGLKDESGSLPAILS